MAFGFIEIFGEHWGFSVRLLTRAAQKLLPELDLC
jgi:hypothetical protein